MSLSNPPTTAHAIRPTFNRAASSFTKSNGFPHPVLSPLFKDDRDASLPADAILELGDGSTFRGIGFGAEAKSVAGECVFQTGPSGSYRRTIAIDDSVQC